MFVANAILPDDHRYKNRIAEEQVKTMLRNRNGFAESDFSVSVQEWIL